jgi:hypothetical protein
LVERAASAVGGLPGVRSSGHPRGHHVATVAPAVGRMNVAGVLAAPVNLNHPGHYVHWGVIQISVANLVVIAVMVLLFVAAVFLPFPKGRRKQ